MQLTASKALPRSIVKIMSEKIITALPGLVFYLSSGLIALILFLILYGLLFFHSKFSYFKMTLFTSLLLFTFIESFFHRQLGGYIFALVLILILFKDKSK